MPVFSRAGVLRTAVMVVGLLLTVVTPSAWAREFRAADTQSEDYPAVEALRYMGCLIAERSGGRHHQGVSFAPARRGNWPSFVTTDHYKYAGYYTLTEHTMSPEVLVMSQKAWESLSAEDRKVFREAALESSRFMRERWKDLEERSRRQAETAGVTIITDFDRTPFETAMDGIYTKARRDPAAAELIERIRTVD